MPLHTARTRPRHRRGTHRTPNAAQAGGAFTGTRKYQQEQSPCQMNPFFDAPVPPTPLLVFRPDHAETTTCGAPARTDARSHSLRQTRTHMHYAECARRKRPVRRTIPTTSRLARRRTAIRSPLPGCERTDADDAAMTRTELRSRRRKTMPPTGMKGAIDKLHPQVEELERTRPR